MSIYLPLFFILLCSNFIQEIEPFNICNEELAQLSYSFFYLMSSVEERDREKVGPLTLICESIIKQKHLFASFIALGISIYFPINTSELYSFSKIIHSLIGFDYISPKYERRFKYVIDALVNNYHMNFASYEIREFSAFFIAHSQWKYSLVSSFQKQGFIKVSSSPNFPFP